MINIQDVRNAYSRLHPFISQPAGHEDRNIVFLDVVKDAVGCSEKSQLADIEPCLFEHFTSRAFLERLAIFEMTAGKGVCTYTRNQIMKIGRINPMVPSP